MVGTIRGVRPVNPGVHSEPAPRLDVESPGRPRNRRPASQYAGERARGSPQQCFLKNRLQLVAQANGPRFSLVEASQRLFRILVFLGGDVRILDVEVVATLLD